jgi:hypothetical protein
MSFQSFPEWDGDAAQNKRAAHYQPVDIVSNTDSHSMFSVYLHVEVTRKLEERAGYAD